MKTLVFAMLMVATPVIGQATAIAVPSGQAVSRIEILWEDHAEFDESWLVLRFLAPDIARDLGGVSFTQAVPDMDFLCRDIGLPAATSFGSDIDVIVVSLVDQLLARGATNPEVTQFNSAYRLVDGDCIWE